MQQFAKVALDQCQLQGVATTEMVLTTRSSIVSFSTLTIVTTHSSGRDGKIIFVVKTKKARKYCTISKPTKNISSDVMWCDVWWVNRRLATTFEQRQTTGSPAHGHVGHAIENLFQLHLGRKNRIKGPKTKMFVKSRFCKVWTSLVSLQRNC